jgi:hypothetical protein
MFAEGDNAETQDVPLQPSHSQLSFGQLQLSSVDHHGQKLQPQ